MRQRAVFAVLFLAAAVGILVFGQPAIAQVPLDPTHYWTYHLLNPAVESQTFEVRDQFFTSYRPLVTMRLERLLNPAWKLHDGVLYAPRDSTAHLDWWTVPPEPVNRMVKVSNQFGQDQMLQVVGLEFMLVPSRKTETPTTDPLPRTINHYLCYKVIGAGPGVDVILRDQFHSQGQMVASATYLCNPCWKRHMGQEYPPVDDTHLVLYRLEIPQFEAPPRFLRDQFIEIWNSPFVQIPDEYLATPSTKEDVPTPTEESSWGRLKTIFR